MKDDIIRMAREAGLRSAVLLHMYGKEDALCDSEIEELRQIERFAALLLAAEREACAELAFEMLVQCEGTDFDVPDAIRARGTHER